jgi:hypothetical protein
MYLLDRGIHLRTHVPSVLNVLRSILSLNLISMSKQDDLAYGGYYQGSERGKESQEKQEIRVPAERGLFLNPMKAPLPSHDGNV